jgi:monoamine oxidase
VEARDRVGGRAHTVHIPVPGLPAASSPVLDVGGQWVGPQQPLCLDLCRRFGIELEEQAWPGGDGTGKVAMAAAAGLAAAPLTSEDATEMDRVDALLKQYSAQAGVPWCSCVVTGLWWR